MELINLNNNSQNSFEWNSFQKEPQDVINIVMSYMTIECKESDLSAEHDSLICRNYHNEFQKRRIPFVKGRLLYGTQICPFTLNYCSKSDSCEMSHNPFEFYFHPSKFRTINCDMKMCEKFGSICPFAHSNEELRSFRNYFNSSGISLQFNPHLMPFQHNNEHNSSLVNHYSKEFNINTFKILKCNNSSKHNEKQCVYFHSQRDFKRMLSLVYYSSDFCKFMELDNQCPNGDQCQRAHNRVEQFYHPEKFKTKFCAQILNTEICPYGQYCSFAHSEEEIKVELIHKLDKTPDFFMFYFKSVWCPINNQHDKSGCVYSHNWQDYRRSPCCYKYSDKMCENWDNHKTILNYSNGCYKEYNCEFSHGWKEQDYHPLIYKTRKCKYFNSECNKGLNCPFYHKNENKRVVSEKERERIFLKIDRIIALELNSVARLNNNSFHKLPSKSLIKKNSIFSIDTGKSSFQENFINNSIITNTIFTQSHKDLGISNLNNQFHRESCPDISTNQMNFQTKNWKIIRNLEKRSSLKTPLRTKDITSQEEDDDFKMSYFGDQKNQTYTTKESSGSFKFGSFNQKSFHHVKDLEIIDEIENYRKKDCSSRADVRYKKQILDYLKINEFNILLKMYEEEAISITDFVKKCDDNSLYKYIEESNKEKFESLVRFIQNLGDAIDYDDILKNIDNDILNNTQI